MKIFIWDRIGHCSDNWHPEGGVAVFADNLERAIELAQEAHGCRIEEDEKPDEVRDVFGGGEKAFWFPDAGCC